MAVLAGQNPNFLTKILKINLDSAGQTIFLGKWNCPALAFFPAREE